jgi:hypothetical protein
MGAALAVGTRFASRWVRGHRIIDVIEPGVRYIVNDVDAAIAFYRDNLGFPLELFEPVRPEARLSQPS